MALASKIRVKSELCQLTSVIFFDIDAPYDLSGMLLIMSRSSLNAGSHIRVLQGALNKAFSDGIVTNRAAKPTVVENITDHTQLVKEAGLTLRGFDEAMDIYGRSSFGG